MDLNKSNIKKILFMAGAVIIFTYAVFNFGTVVKLFHGLIGLLMPFIIGFCIAFILNVPMKGYERLLFKNKDGRFYRFRRPVCIILSVLSVAFVITFVITLVLPEVKDTIITVADKIPDFFESTKKWGAGLMNGKYADQIKKISDMEIDLNKITGTAIDMVKNGGSSLILTTFSFASSLIGLLVDIVVGIFFAIYVLSQKENLEKQVKGLVYTVLKEKNADRVIRTFALGDQTFTNFVSGQCLEACILGFMFFITMSVLSIPYALTVSITIALTALIPVFGSFMGCGIGVFLILVENPHKVILFIIIFIILQQIEGNLIYPHVVGGSVGLPSIWVLVAVVVGGDLMGVIGMLIFVPLTSVIYAIVREYVIKTIKEKNISWEKYGCDCDIPENSWRSRAKEKQEEKKKRKEAAKIAAKEEN